MSYKSYSAALLAGLTVLAAAQSPDAVRAALAAKVDAANQAGAMGIAGKDGWLFFVPELRYLTVGRFWGPDAAKASRAPAQFADPLPAIADYKKQLDALGVDLLVVPVPAKAAIYPEMVVDGAAVDTSNRIDQAQADFIQLLNSQGIKTLDLTTAFLQYKAAHPDILLYSKTDTHWSGAGLNLAADLVAAEIRSKPWYAPLKKTQFTVSTKAVTAKGDIVDMLKSDPPDPETFALSGVTVGGTPIVFDKASPVLILGDSHTLVFSSGQLITSGAGFPENLAAKTGVVPDVAGVEGSGATQARRSFLQMRGGVDGKKILVWVFTARDFTESPQGWHNVPVKRP